MKKIFLKCIAAASALTMLCTAAFAAEIPYAITYDYANNAISVGGDVVGSKFVTLQILKYGTDADVFNTSGDNSMVMWRGQNSASDGSYLFDIGYADDITKGSYAAVLTTDGEYDKTVLTSLYIASSTDYAEAVAELNSLAKAGKAEEFVAFVESNGNTLAFDFTLYDKITGVGVTDSFYNYVKSNPLSESDSGTNTKVFNSFVLIEALNREVIDNIELYIGKTVLADSSAYADYKSAAGTEAEQKYLTAKMTGGSIRTLEELENTLKQGIVLGKIYNASGFGDVRDILAQYGDLFGIEGSASDDVYKAMCGMDYDNAKALLTHYNSLKNSTSSGSGTTSGLGVGSGSGGGSSKASAYMNGKFEAVEASGDMHKVEVYFNDIDGVEWASEAIVALADKGIINGKSEGYFQPNAKITREEFVKILVGAMGYENEPYDGNVFGDVNADDWFCSYVNIAYSKGLVKGIGDGLFGTGELITRQDMSVMLYNAMLMAGSDIPSGEIVFEDAYMISDYAVSAIGTLCELGIVNGVSETMFEPLGDATRAQAAKVVYGALNYLQ